MCWRETVDIMPDSKSLCTPHAGVRVKLRKPKPVSPPITKYFERKPLAALNRVISKFEGPQKLMKSVCTPGNSALASQAEHKVFINPLYS